jgi:TolA-binding protein
LPDDGWRFLPEAAAPLMLAAIRALGAQALSRPVTDEPMTAETCGSRLLQLVFADRTQARGGPALTPVSGRDRDDGQRRAELETLASDAFGDDPAAADRAADLIAAYHRQRADGGDVQALVNLGDFLYWDRPEAARAAYQDAIDGGYLHALIDLALLLESRFADEDAAFAAYRQAIAHGQPDLAAEAMYELGSRSWRDDETAATAMLQQAIDTGHPRWAGQAMIFLGGRLNRAGDQYAAEALWRQAMQTGDPETSAHASFTLGEMLQRKGDTEEAKTLWRRVIQTRDPQWADAALVSLVNLLAKQDDANGLRDAYNLAVAHENPDALYALTQLGQVLEAQGDITGAHEAWQQAIDAGCEEPDYWRERISPPPPPPARQRPEPAAYPDDLPPEFSPRNMTRTGIHVLEHGLPPLPETMTYDMAIPVAYWKAERCAVVLVLRYPSYDRDDDPEPLALQLTYTRAEDGTWTPPKHAAGASFGYDPITKPDGALYGLDGRAIVYGGGSSAATVTPGRPACIAEGHVAPEIKYLALIKDDREDRRQLDSHFGAWVICTEQDGSFEVAAIDSGGTTLGSLQLP